MQENAQQFIAAGYNPCTQGMHKMILPLGSNTWQCRAENTYLANKCNSLVSASSTSLDLILSNISSSLLANGDIIVVTSNVTHIACIQHMLPSIAATAQHLWGNPSPQYLNVITIAANLAITDTGSMSIFIMEGVEVPNKHFAIRPLTINLPNGKKVMLTHICDINIPGLPTVLTGHIVPSLTITSLIGFWPLCKVGCKVVFDNKKYDVIFKGKVILHGFKDPTTDLWTLPIPTKVCTAPGSTVLPQPGPCWGHAPNPPIDVSTSNRKFSARRTSTHKSQKEIYLQVSHWKDIYPQVPGDTLATFMHSVWTRANAVKFPYQSLCNCKILTLLKAVCKGFLKGCPNILERLIHKYLNPSSATAKGHMKQPRHSTRSTHHHPALMAQPAPPALPLFGAILVYPGPATVRDQDPMSL